MSKRVVGGNQRELTTTKPALKDSARFTISRKDCQTAQ